MNPSMIPTSSKALTAAAFAGVLAILPNASAIAQTKPPVAQPQLTFNLSADPGAELSRVSIWRNGQRVALADSPDVPLHIDLSPPLPEALWLVADWKSGGQFSAYPIILVHTLAGLKSDVLFVKDAANKPSQSEILRKCEETVKSIQHAFIMYFTCKAAAVAEVGESKTKRAALQGWLKANLYLVKAIRPISPFSYDADLADTLRNAVQKADQNGNPEDWRPLRIEDARAYVASSDARDVSLYKLVAPLKDGGDLEGALAILDYVTQAYDAIVGPDGNQPIDRIDRKLLMDSRQYLAHFGPSSSH